MRMGVKRREKKAFIFLHLLLTIVLLIIKVYEIEELKEDIIDDLHRASKKNSRGNAK